MKRLLIANRGEIACRIIRACQLMGIETVAVYSDADANALHTTMADQAVHIGPAAARDSYLNSSCILQVAKSTQADAIHPGYGFLSESADFAKKVQDAGLIWVGPNADTIKKMGDKDHARAIAVEAGVPVLPGSPRIQADMDVDLAALANDIGYPILVKATGGGGGMGMKNVMCQAELDSAVQAALQLAGKAFGESAVFLEKYITRARHIEIQIFGYGDGDVIHLYERDCSIQRRFQKVVEESPAPEVAESIRMAMAEAAVKLAAHQRYAGPGTVEFIFDTQTQRFYFLEMNTRIQVEHPVTEMVTGLDIVRHQLELASGVFEKIAQSEVCHSGVAIECRLYAENPEKDFLPSPGLLNVFTLPETGSHCRVETGYRPNDRISPYYDPMIAKLIVWGATRAVAIEAMQDALKQSVIDGPKHNVKLLQAIMADPDYIAGKVHTAFLESRKAVLINTP